MITRHELFTVAVHKCRRQYSLSVEDRKAADLSATGKIVDMKVEESDDWLIFRVDWIRSFSLSDVMTFLSQNNNKN